MFKFESTLTWIDRSGQVAKYEPEQFQERCLKFASAFARIESKDLCLLWEPSIDAYAAFIGAMLADKVPSFFSVPTFKLDKAYFTRQLDSLKSHRYFTIGSKAMDGLGLDLLVSVDHEQAAPMPASYSGAFMQFSSGTTGMRKSISYCGTDAYRHNEAYAAALKLKEKECVVSWLPHYHDMGLIAAFLMPLQLGHDLVYMSNMSWVSRPKMLLDAIENFKGSLCWQPNFAFQLMTERCDAADLSRTKFISCAEPVLERVSREFETKFSTNVQGCYALAENVFAATQGQSAKSYGSVRSSGAPISGNEVKILNDEILIRSEYLFKGYQSGELSRIENGWYHTGDHGVILDGELFVLGRVDDSFKIRGEKIIPELIEGEVNQVAGIHAGRVACIPYSAKSGQSESVILVYEGELAELDLFKQVRHLGVEKCIQVPDNWLIKSSSGKVARKQCKQKLIEYQQ